MATKSKKTADANAQTAMLRETRGIGNVLRRAEITGNGGKHSPLPMNSVQALRTLRFRVRKEYLSDPDLADPVSDIAGYSLERMVHVMGGRGGKAAPSILKASVALREEFCEPIVKETRLSGNVGLAAAVIAVQKELDSGTE